MPVITFIQHDGAEHHVEATVGRSLMQAAVDQSVPGILGDCGGNCACATCHGFIEPSWLSRLDAADADENMMLTCAAEPPRDNSRLLCQIVVNEQLDGMRVHLPENQL